jgi:hypothetical protein
MAGTPKDHADAVVNHGRDLKKVSEQLKTLMASLRSERERHEAEARSRPAGGASPSPTPAPSADPEVARLSSELALSREAVAHANDERERLRVRLSEIEAEYQRMCDEYVALQEQSTQVAQLFAALERIHGGSSRTDTIAALQEIVINVIGSEELAIFERRGDALTLVHSFGVDPGALRGVRLGRGAIGQAAATGRTYLSRRDGPPAPGDEDVTAVVPLRVGDEIAGAIAIFRLLGQKPGLVQGDEDLFDLLSSHAGIALRLRGPHPVAG